MHAFHPQPGERRVYEDLCLLRRLGRGGERRFLRIDETFHVSVGQLQRAGLGLHSGLESGHAYLVDDGLDGDEVRQVDDCSFLRVQNNCREEKKKREKLQN